MTEKMSLAEITRAEAELSRKVGFSLAFCATNSYITEYKKRHENLNPPTVLLYQFHAELNRLYKGDISNHESQELKDILEIAWEGLL